MIIGKYTREQQDEFIRKIEELRSRGMRVSAACTQVGIDVKYYGNWTQRNKRNALKGQPKVREIVPMTNDKDKRIKLLEIENQRLKMIVADLSLDKMQLIEYSGRNG